MTRQYGELWGIALAPSGGGLVAGCDDGRLRMQYRESGALIRDVLLDNGDVYCVASAPSGARLAARRDDGNLRIVDFESGAVIRVVAVHNVRRWRTS